MQKATVRIEFQCAECGSAAFVRPDDTTNDPLIVCAKCGTTIGPKSSFDAIRIGDPHTFMRVNVVNVLNEDDV